MAKMIAILMFDFKKKMCTGLGARNLGTEDRSHPRCLQMEAAAAWSTSSTTASTGERDGCRCSTDPRLHRRPNVEKESWLSSFFAAEGEFRHAETVGKPIWETRRESGAVSRSGSARISLRTAREAAAGAGRHSVCQYSVASHPDVGDSEFALLPVFPRCCFSQLSVDSQTKPVHPLHGVGRPDQGQV